MEEQKFRSSGWFGRRGKDGFETRTKAYLLKLNENN